MRKIPTSSLSRRYEHDELAKQTHAPLERRIRPEYESSWNPCRGLRCRRIIQGDSAVGKSEAALGLIERGHRLISDDIVKVKKREGSHLEGSGAELTRHHMEIRGIGIINVANLYGAVCVRDYKSIDIVVKLESWDDQNFYDRVGLDEKYCDILGVKLPFHILPVKPGRDVVLLLETIALNHRLKGMGYHSAREFNSKLLGMINDKPIRRKRAREVLGKSNRTRIKWGSTHARRQQS